ncbi:hypothetical protein MLD38_040087 [Melastoma candidum]|uniref:Uncharacterized protein n=1 Tax=Melastoma candidum TaxID=119954 RepID=A0ACB9L4M4_9MYRT|nr:hypothetical protein MLD38_040087 [Melastoma candidum]
MSKQAYSFKICFCFKRIFKLREAEPPGDVKRLFEDYSKDGIMTIDDLLRFMVEFQKETDATKEDALAIFYSLRHLNIFQGKGLHLHAFFRYLLGDLNPPVPPSSKVHHSMSAPLSHYFMFTGHNSYLTGNQLSSDSSSAPIIKALKNNVRVIELDLWPNAGKDRVEVCHGGTLTSPVDLAKCLQAARDYAFVASDYPVVLTFEDHLTPFLQSKVAELVTKTFGAMLHRPETGPMAEFPSPDSLKRKILISTKPPKEYLEFQKSMEEENELDQEEQSAQQEQDENEGNVFPEYRHLISIHAGKPKGGVEGYLRIDPTRVRRLSLSEQELDSISGTYGPDIVRFSQRNLLRIYPKGLRFDSSNYNPFLGWAHGAQMVAVNMQGYGKFLWIMQGMFRGNGGCGYIRKPDLLMNPVDIFDPRKTLPPKTILKVTVYLGEGWHLDFRKTHFDKFSPPDFYARVGIAGVAADSIMKRTSAIEDEWIPSWNEEFEFQITVPELAVLRIEVLEYDTTGSPDFGGQTCLPVSELREGIRAVPLHSRKGERYRSVKLLMRFQFIPC